MELRSGDKQTNRGYDIKNLEGLDQVTLEVLINSCMYLAKHCIMIITEKTTTHPQQFDK